MSESEKENLQHENLSPEGRITPSVERARLADRARSTVATSEQGPLGQEVPHSSIERHRTCVVHEMVSLFLLAAGKRNDPTEELLSRFNQALDALIAAVRADGQGRRPFGSFCADCPHDGRCLDSCQKGRQAPQDQEKNKDHGAALGSQPLATASEGTEPHPTSDRIRAASLRAADGCPLEDQGEFSVVVAGLGAALEALRIAHERIGHKIGLHPAHTHDGLRRAQTALVELIEELQIGCAQMPASEHSAEQVSAAQKSSSGTVGEGQLSHAERKHDCKHAALCLNTQICNYPQTCVFGNFYTVERYEESGRKAPAWAEKHRKAAIPDGAEAEPRLSIIEEAERHFNDQIDKGLDHYAGKIAKRAFRNAIAVIKFGSVSEASDAERADERAGAKRLKPLNPTTSDHSG